MSNRKNHNSIIFLTTLSVYLGLVLVGGGAATPSVFAQAAMTRQEYEIKFAKENKDELDKPLDEENLFIPQTIRLIQELSFLASKHKFDWNQKASYIIEGLEFCESDNSPSFLGTGRIGDKNFDGFDNFAIKLGREISKRKVAFGFGDFYSQDVAYDFSTNNSVFTIKTTVENRNAQETLVFSGELKNYFDKFASTKKASKEKLIYENTSLTSENNQIFIVTRLARASIDELLADKTARYSGEAKIQTFQLNSTRLNINIFSSKLRV